MGSGKCVWALVGALFLVSACGNMANDLNPSGQDKRVPAAPGTPGSSVEQKAPDFTLLDTQGNEVTLSSVVTTTGVKGVVLYFTMWCPVCNTHMNDMWTGVIPLHPDVRFYAVDYVSGSVAAALQAQID